jgi:hypothetical protein
MKTVLFMVLMAFSTLVNADSLQITLGGYHFQEKGQNNFLPGLIYGSSLTDNASVIAGGYYNSHRKLSALAGLEAHYGHIGVQLAGVTGYKHLTGYPVRLMAAAYLEWEGFRLSATPDPENGLVFISYVFRWDNE